MNNKKTSTYVRESEVEIDYKGPMEGLISNIMEKKEGIYIAYDENLVEVINALAHHLKKPPAQIIWDGLQRGLNAMIDEL